VGLGIIAGSMATFRPLLRIVLGKTKFSSGYSLNGASSGGTLPGPGRPARSSSQKDIAKNTWSSMTVDDIGLPSSYDSNSHRLPI